MMGLTRLAMRQRVVIDPLLWGRFLFFCELCWPFGNVRIELSSSFRPQVQYNPPFSPFWAMKLEQYRAQHNIASNSRTELVRRCCLRLSLAQRSFRILFSAKAYAQHNFISCPGAQHQVQSPLHLVQRGLRPFWVEIYFAFVQFWSELGSDFKSIHALFIPNGINPERTSEWGFQPPFRDFGVLHCGLATNAGHQSAPYLCMCMRAERLAQLHCVSQIVLECPPKRQAPLNYSLSG